MARKLHSAFCAHQSNQCKINVPATSCKLVIYGSSTEIYSDISHYILLNVILEYLQCLLYYSNAIFYNFQLQVVESGPANTGPAGLWAPDVYLYKFSRDKFHGSLQIFILQLSEFVCKMSDSQKDSILTGCQISDNLSSSPT